MDTKWVALALVGIAFLSLMRIISQWRRFARRPVGDWDEQFIMQLRKAGVNPFSDHMVDFFFTLPSAEACRTVQKQLSEEGFALVSQAQVPGGTYSLNLQKTMRLVIPDMQALTARFQQIAEELGGSYDNWAVARPRE